ncbi:MAG: diguanylate cyclase domain-containing protein [Spirochaetales bacterium]
MLFLNPALFAQNASTIPMLILSAVALVCAVLVLTREHATELSTVFFVFAAAAALYLFAAALARGFREAEMAHRWLRVSFTGLSIMPAAGLALALRLGRKRTLYSWATPMVAILSLVFVVLALATDDFVDVSVVSGSSGFFPSLGVVGFFYIAFVAAVLIAICLLLASRMRDSHSIQEKRRLLGMMIAFTLGTFGGVSFVPALRAGFYALTFVPISLSIVLNALVVLKYRFVDITESMAAAQILRTVTSAVLVTDLDGLVQLANGVAERYLELPAGTSRGAPLPPEFDQRSRGDYDSVQEDGEPYDITYDDRVGNRRILSVVRTPLRDRRSLVIGHVYVARDVTSIRRTERKLRQLALYDSLTGLPNRVLFFDRLHQVVARAKRTGESVAILYIDLDKFKSVNDDFGHEAGDTVLREAAERMIGCTRATDTIARVGGDEFIGICENTFSEEDVNHVAGKIVEVLLHPFQVDEYTIRIGVSIGISILPRDGLDEKVLLARADEAMYLVKKSGKSGFCVFDAAAEDSQQQMT